MPQPVQASLFWKTFMHTAISTMTNDEINIKKYSHGNCFSVGKIPARETVRLWFPEFI